VIRALGDAVGRTLDGMRRRPVHTAVAIGVIAAAFALVGLADLAARNVASLASGWRPVQMIVYLEPGVGDARAREIGAVLSRLQAVDRVEYVTPQMAMERLRGAIGEHDELVEGLEPTLMPASLEVTLAAGIKEVAAGHPLIERLEQTAGVEEIEITGAWVERVSTLMTALRAAGWFLLVLMAGACVYLTVAALRLGTPARRREVEVLRLLGASPRAIRGPILLEGVVQGAAGAAIAAGLLWLLYRGCAGAVREALGTVFGAAEIGFLPPHHVWALIAAGAGLGLAGSWLAAGRHA
jgi:cell division transport system permease protein